MMEWAVSIWSSATERRPQPRIPNWDRLCATLTRPLVVGDTPKADLAAWSPTIYREGSTRGAAGVTHLTCLVLDYDEGIEPHEAIELWKSWPGILHTSISHTLNAPKFRVVLPLAEPIPVHQWAGVWAWAFNHSGGHIDEKCKDPARIYFMPCLRQKHSPWRAHTWAPFFDLLGTDAPWADELAALAAPPAPILPRPPIVCKEKHRVRAMRALLKSDPYARLELARQLQADTDGETLARHIPCPQCGRSDVWFAIQPDRKHTAQCNHQSSCGWWGDLLTLFHALGGTL